MICLKTTRFVESWHLRNGLLWSLISVIVMLSLPIWNHNWHICLHQDILDVIPRHPLVETSITFPPRCGREYHKGSCSTTIANLSILTMQLTVVHSWSSTSFLFDLDYPRLGVRRASQMGDSNKWAQLCCCSFEILSDEEELFFRYLHPFHLVFYKCLILFSPWSTTRSSLFNQGYVLFEINKAGF